VRYIYAPISGSLFCSLAAVFDNVYKFSSEVNIIYANARKVDRSKHSTDVNEKSDEVEKKKTIRSKQALDTKVCTVYR
jgi:hypothetical protein